MDMTDQAESSSMITLHLPNIVLKENREKYNTIEMKVTKHACNNYSSNQKVNNIFGI